MNVRIAICQLKQATPVCKELTCEARDTVTRLALSITSLFSYDSLTDDNQSIRPKDDSMDTICQFSRNINKNVDIKFSAHDAFLDNQNRKIGKPNKLSFWEQ